MGIRITCDRCGESIDGAYMFLETCNRAHYVYGTEDWDSREELLCQDCANDFEKFMAQENVITNLMAVS